MSVVDTTATVLTPENIAFDYQLAGPFRRLPAYVIDLVVRGMLLIAMALAFVLTTSMVSANWIQSYIWAAILIGNFLLSFFYGAVCESTFNGRTVGKAICGIRVIGTDGRPITGSSAMLRNLLRPADMMPMAPLTVGGSDQWVEGYPIPTALVALVVMTMTRRMQRLGDLAAGTMVIIDEKSAKLSVTKFEDKRVAGLASFIPADYRVTQSMAKMLATYVERRNYLSPPRRHEIANHLAKSLIERFEFRQDLDPDLLMMALYYQTFLHDETSDPVDDEQLRHQSPLASGAQPSVVFPAEPVIEFELDESPVAKPPIGKIPFDDERGMVEESEDKSNHQPGDEPLDDGFNPGRNHGVIR